MKGSVIDLIIVFVILGITMMGLLFGLKIYNDGFADKWPTTSVGNVTKTGMLAALDVINYGTLFLAIGLVSALVVSAFFINTHPVFFLVSVMMLVIVIIVAAPISNAFMEVATNAELSTEASSFSVATAVVGNLPLIAVAGGFLIIIALYAKPGGNGGGGV